MNETSDRFAGIDGILGSFDEVRDILGPVHPFIADKVIDHLDDISRAFIARSPFLIMATSGDTHIEVSPKGDPAGFVKVLDDRHLVIPERPGNRRADSYRNLFENPSVGLIFLIPGKTETLRVSGEARIVRDEALRRSLEVNGNVPEFAVVVYVERVLGHCPKCMMRSRLWEPDAWPDATGLADVGETYIEHSKLDMSPQELFELAEKEGLTKVY